MNVGIGYLLWAYEMPDLAASSRFRISNYE